MGAYNVYRGIGRPGAIDWDTPVAACAAGSAVLTITGAGHVADTVYYYGVKAESDAGVESDAETRICRVVVDSEGDLQSPLPGAMLYATVAPAAAGAATATWRYDQPDGDDWGQAVTIEAAVVTAGAADWESLIGSWTVAAEAASTRRVAAELSGTYTDGEVLTVAFRAVTADEQTGAETLASCLIDADAPDPVAYVAAAAAE